MCKKIDFGKMSTEDDVYSGKNGQAPNVRYYGRFRYCGCCLQCKGER